MFILNLVIAGLMLLLLRRNYLNNRKIHKLMAFIQDLQARAADLQATADQIAAVVTGNGTTAEQQAVLASFDSAIATLKGVLTPTTEPTPGQPTA